MPKISEKGLAMPASPIRKLVPYAEEAKRKGRKVYHLNIGQPDIPTPQVALDAVKSTDLKVIEYSHSAGIESYRRGLAKYYQGLGIDITHNDMIITTGGSEAITIAFMTCLNPGDEVIIPEPFYANYNGFAVQAGVVVKPIVSRIENDFALPPVEEFEKLITPRTKGIVICNPNNPTGYLYSREELEQLATIVKKHDLYLFSDEVYREFCYDGITHYSAMMLKGLENNVILMDSVSKRYSMCGVRIGALITRNKEVIAAAMKFAQARLSPPSFGQIAAEAALNTPAEYFKEVYDEYIKRRNFMVEALNKMDGVYCPKPKGAFYTVVRLPIDDSDKFAQWLLEHFEHKNQTVMLAPATGFYSTPGLGKNEVRIAYVLNVDDLRNAMECLEVALKQYPGRTL
ncbi:pyridoxal phosphate-dependent aminotransferase [Tenuifilum sp.]|uniref:pyridoxal phosphate-dependent aminotransferase n=1 Tax=Tenuifilum sp. TaxID=2760880 RepID=UPI001B4299B3|nr:pyridoxal phosphate-dependent aminotransferase [Bacteroidales bacterium]HOU75284.1 pyridoxal phosphate-dependent aminotransferase [Tenuifilum sp.]MBP9030334.1 pyridoxal phosphate-dependent aminotransferase [Bacteroidales bacterium]HQE54626.1 pyridoxal phosphate-dependent aminotransferase [Tenuifilum sp.]HQI89277.1 pyridoxal phosphate-dependent aminotransferase [Tenuifilum sp.]